MRCSIVMSTRDKAEYLARTLDSIYIQHPSFDFEVIVVDDGSTDNTKEICDQYEVSRYIKLDTPTYRNPSVARNVGYRASKGEIIIAQSDEVVHTNADTIEQLCERLSSNEFLIATVYNYNVSSGKRLQLYTGVRCQRPFFFLGSLWKKDLYAVGGCDEEFTNPGFDDDWFGDCLIKGSKLKVRFLGDIIGYHQDHPRPPDIAASTVPSRELYKRKVEMATRGDTPWISSGGPWT